jgi:hypothetical protein
MIKISESLQRLCEASAAKFRRARDVTLTCAAVEEDLPLAVATRRLMIAQAMTASAYRALEGSRGGRIAVSFTSDDAALVVHVEHSAAPREFGGRPGSDGSWLARTVVARMGGRFERLNVIGGVHMVATLPRHGRTESER